MSYNLKIAPEKKFKSKNDLISFIQTNKSDLIKLKKMKMKYTDKSFSNAYKSSFTPKINVDSDKIMVKAVINSTNYIDAHDDLHLAPIWNKTVKDNPTTYHLENHKQSFDGILSSKALNSIQDFSFKDLGFDSEMNTRGLVSDFILERKNNPLIFDMYANGEVKQHSVGMQYVDIDLIYAFDDDEQSQKDLEDVLQYAANPEVGKDLGYVFVVKQAKRIEGSAVLFGSNPITPTLEVKNYEPLIEKSTQEIIIEEPPIKKALTYEELKNILTN